MEFTAVYQKAPEGGFVAWVEELPGAITQGETLEETRANLREAIELILATRREQLAEDHAEGEIIREPITIAS